ncbi:Ger(x)C family spore germination protein [Oceanobacillus sp. CAU 1775]
MQNKILLLLLVVIFILQACIPTSQIEQTAIINARGIDLVEEEDDGKFIETTIIPYIFDPQAQEIIDIISGKGTTIKGAREDAEKKTSFELSPGHIRVEVYGKEAAESGILSFVNTLIRDARVSEMMLLAVTNQSAKEVLETERQIDVNAAQYLQDLISKEIYQDALPGVTLHDFTRTVEQVGIDPILPLIEVIDEFPTLNGAALLHIDKYVGEIPIEDAFLVNLFRKNVKRTPLEAHVPTEEFREYISDVDGDREEENEKIHVFLSLITGKSKLKLVDQEALKYKVEINLKVELLETSALIDIKTRSTKKKLEKNIENFYKEKYETLFAKLQEHNSDAFGLGRLYNATRKGSGLTNEEWTKQFPETTLEFDINVKILNTGTID